VKIHQQREDIVDDTKLKLCVHIEHCENWCGGMRLTGGVAQDVIGVAEAQGGTANLL